MPKSKPKASPQPYPAEPLIEWAAKIGDTHARKRLGDVSAGRFGNWKKRGVPHFMIAVVCKEMGIDLPAYLRRAGIVTPHLRDASSDVLREQLLELYPKLSEESRDKLVHFANFLYSEENPGRSREAPFNHVPVGKPQTRVS